MTQISFRAQIDEYTNRVLGVVKEKFGLKDKSQALNKFAEMYGEEFVEREASDEYIKKVLDIAERHIKKYGYKKLTLKELDRLCEAE